jgi:hypothetical protein
MSPQDYEYLLVAAELAQFHQTWGFSIKKLKWKLFLEGHRFSTTNCTGSFEVDSKKLDLNAFINGESPKHREQVYFIRIGILIVNSPRKIEMQKDSDGRMISTPPRLNGLRLRQHSFWSLMDPFVWNYVVDNDLDGVKEVEDLSSDDNESVVSSEILVNSEVSSPSSVDGAIITPVKSATPVDNHTSTKYPHLSRALGDENGYFNPADPSC